MPSFLAIADFLRPQSLKLGSTFIYGVRISFESFSGVKDSYFHAQYHRLRSRRGPKKAIGAVASSLLTTAYHMLKSGTLYQDLGANHFNHRAKDKQALHLIHRLKNLGFNVHITPSPA
jgi:hypothetical protein